MTDSARDELLQVLKELSDASPDVRFGQLILNLAYLARGFSNESAWEVEDDELLAAAKKHLEEWRDLRGVTT